MTACIAPKANDIWLAGARSRRTRKVCFACAFSALVCSLACSWLLDAEETFVNVYECSVKREGVACRSIFDRHKPIDPVKGTDWFTAPSTGKRWRIQDKKLPNVDSYPIISTEWDDGEPAKILPYGSKEREEYLPYADWRGNKAWTAGWEIQGDQYRQWYHFDAEKKDLDELGKAIAKVLIGTNSILYDHMADMGAFAVVTNCERVRVPGRFYHYKLYLSNLSKRPGHIRVERFKEVIKRFPERVIMRAVWEAMPSSKRNKRIFKERLKLFAGPNHLYHNKAPVEYPMHHVKDVTYSDGLKQEDLFVNRMGMNKEKAKMKSDYKEFQQKTAKLRSFKNFVKEYIKENGGEEAFADRSIEEVQREANTQRLRQTYVETMGQPVPERKKKIFFKTYFEKKRVRAMGEEPKGDYDGPNQGLGTTRKGGWGMPPIK